MAMRCLYCGGSSWRPFRWLRGQEFCSSKHRELYRARLQKVVGELANYQPLPGHGLVDSNPAVEADAAQTGSAEAVPEEHASSMPETAPAHARMAPEMVLRDPALTQELTKVLGLSQEAPATVWLPPEVFSFDLRPREGLSGEGISPHVPLPASAAGARSPIHFFPGTLPAAFENHVQIKRWGLKIRFQKV